MLVYEKLGISEDCIEEIRQKPSLHILCAGAMLLENIRISDDILLVAAMPIGNQTRATILAKYAVEILGVPFDKSGFEHAIAKGMLNEPLSILVIKHEHDGSAVEVYEKIKHLVDLSLNVASSIVGRPLMPFYELYVFNENKIPVYRMVGSNTQGSQNRLTGVLKYENDNDALTSRLFKAAQREDRLEFILTLVHDVTRENNLEFKIARVFNLLEAIAWEQKKELKPLSRIQKIQKRIYRFLGLDIKVKQEQVGSRTAVRRLLNFEGKDAIREFEHDGIQYKFDPIEYAGRVRDKFYHGGRIRKSKLPKTVKPGYDLMKKNPKLLTDVLLDFAKLVIYSWVDEILEEKTL